MRILGVRALCLAAGAVATIMLAVGPAGAAVTWSVVASPPPSSALWLSLSARADNDAWAIAQGSATTPLADRWNGTTWTQVPGPSIAGDISTVPYGVSASSASDAWMVGRGTKFRNIVTPFAAHWNGVSWALVSLPTGGVLLRSVVDISSSDAYAVGQTVAMHWNGSAWSTISVPAPGGAAPVNFDAVAADSPSDVWVTGLYFDPATSSDLPFSAHFDGTTWTSVPLPAGQAGELFGLTAVSPGDVWAVGSDNGTGITDNWNGSSWRAVPNPAQGILLGVTATGSGNVTAVGHNTTANGPTAAIILSWNGTSWTSDTVPSVGSTEELFATSAAPGGSVTWALGSFTNSAGGGGSLLLRNG